MPLVHDHDGEYAFADTDSLFIVATTHGGHIPCPGGHHHTPDHDHRHEHPPPSLHPRPLRHGSHGDTPPHSDRTPVASSCH